MQGVWVLAAAELSQHEGVPPNAHTFYAMLAFAAWARDTQSTHLLRCMSISHSIIHRKSSSRGLRQHTSCHVHTLSIGCGHGLTRAREHAYNYPSALFVENTYQDTIMSNSRPSLYKIVFPDAVKKRDHDLACHT
eukprot:1138294-Pelagomonas_calceolata.AAC.7